MVRAKKSTIGRAKLTALRTTLWIAERLAPGPGARLATSLWFKLPAGPAPTAVPDGAAEFSVESMGHAVRGLTWGDGPVVYAMHGRAGRGDQFAAFIEPLVASGHRVVVFDAPSHGASDAGPSGQGRSNGVEFGRALDAVAARFGPARAVLAHSMGAVPVLLALRDGWVGADRLVMISPISELATYIDRLDAIVGLGPRIRRGMDTDTKRRTGYPIAEFAFPRLAEDLGSSLPPTLVIHDRADKVTSYAASARIVGTLPAAELVSTDGLGHRRILQDPGVVAATVAHVRGVDSEPDDARSEAEPHERADAIA